ncbi:hypothetical protein ACFQNE_13815 [Gordonia phosphorivorans]|uniref:Uncharacterized protein n=2 Tax=Gordonia TaxID=2053 RepID=A0ABP8ZKA7_9ACTN
MPEIERNQIGARVLAFAQWYKDQGGPPRHVLVVIRDGEPAVWIDHTEVDDLLGEAGMVAYGYGADALAVVLEAVVPLVPVNPITGEEWESGEADDVFRQHDGVAQGCVTECQVVELQTRDGYHLALARPFVVTDASIDWSAKPLETGGAGVGGILARALSRPGADPAAVRDPGDAFVAPADAPVYPSATGRMVLDIGLTRILDRKFKTEAPEGSVRVIVADDAEAERYRAEGLDDDQLMVVAQ